MKKFVIAMTVVLTITSGVWAAPIVQINGGDPAYSITVTWLNPGQTKLGIYSLGQTYNSFCLEEEEVFSPGSVYYAQINDRAILGGEAVADLLDARTAYLYTGYMNGVYGYTDTVEQDLQDAIHFIEDEGGVYNTYALEADTAVAPGGSWFAKGLGAVRVLNLWTRYNTATGEFSGYAQDQLILVPAPAALILGSLGTALVGWLRRKKKF